MAKVWHLISHKFDYPKWTFLETHHMNTLIAKAVNLLPKSSTDEYLDHPMLDIFRPNELPPFNQKPYLYQISSIYGEEFDPDFAPIPTSSSKLPSLEDWNRTLILSVLEIWAGKRSPNQLARWCQSPVFQELTRNVGSQSIVGKLRKIHIQEPLDGLCEAIATVRFNERLRSIAIRLEGVDGRWLCTNLKLI